MTTTCSVDDLGALYDAAGHEFATLLRDLAMQHVRIKQENARLLAKIEDGLLKRKMEIENSCSKRKMEIQNGTSKHTHETRVDIDRASCPKQDHASERVSFKSDDERVFFEQDGVVEPVLPDLASSALQTTSGILSTDGVVLEERSIKLSIEPQSPEHVRSCTTTTSNHSQNMRLHFIWTQSVEDLEGIRSQGTPTKNLACTPADGVARGGDLLRQSGCMQKFIVGPNDVKRMLWDMLSIIMLTGDIVMAPMVAFEIPETDGIKVLNVSSTAFWTCDMLASFLTGFHDEGAIEMRPSKVAKNYIRSWFPFDSAVVSADWTLLASTSGLAGFVGLSRASKLLRVGRILRTLRLFRLLRVFKLPALLEDVTDVMRTDGLLIGFRIFRALMTILCANHFLACGWYAVGKLSNPSWITELDEADRDLAFRYVSALHWSLTQFTPASMEIHARGFPERVYSICVLFLALIVFSSFVSSITNAMNHLRQINKESTKQRRNLRRYIQENRLSLALTNRVTSFARCLNVRARARVHENEIEAFKVLPLSLKLQLHWEVYAPVLSRHPVFFHCIELYESFLLELCHTAVSEKSLMTGQELFSPDEQASSMYFTITGSLEYYESHMDDILRVPVVKQCEWCCEAALWLSWVHRGHLAALSHSEMVTLDASLFRDLVTQKLSLFEICKSYAIQFQEFAMGLSDDTPLDVLRSYDRAARMSRDAFAPRVSQRNLEEPSIWKKMRHTISMHIGTTN